MAEWNGAGWRVDTLTE
ncbi:unnamed protein product, partial [Rotaria sordida]